MWNQRKNVETNFKAANGRMSTWGSARLFSHHLNLMGSFSTSRTTNGHFMNSIIQWTKIFVVGIVSKQGRSKMKWEFWTSFHAKNLWLLKKRAQVKSRNYIYDATTRWMSNKACHSLYLYPAGTQQKGALSCSNCSFTPWFSFSQRSCRNKVTDYLI